MNKKTDSFPRITEEELNNLKSRLGVKISRDPEPWCFEATRDNIRHYAHGIGDDNPLWCEPDYAAKTKYHSIIALPSFLFSTSRIASGYVGGLPGIHAMWAGANWKWHLPVFDPVDHFGVVEVHRKERLIVQQKNQVQMLLESSREFGCVEVLHYQLRFGYGCTRYEGAFEG